MGESGFGGGGMKPQEEEEEVCCDELREFWAVRCRPGKRYSMWTVGCREGGFVRDNIRDVGGKNELPFSFVDDGHMPFHQRLRFFTRPKLFLNFSPSQKKG